MLTVGTAGTAGGDDGALAFWLMAVPRVYGGECFGEEPMWMKGRDKGGDMKRRNEGVKGRMKQNAAAVIRHHGPTLALPPWCPGEHRRL